MTDYFLDVEYNNLTYGEQDVNLKGAEANPLYKNKVKCKIKVNIKIIN